MSLRTLSALILLVLACTPVFAQDSAPVPAAGDTGHSFKLLRDNDTAATDLDLADAEAGAWTPALKKGTIEVSLGIGFLGLNKTLLKHDQIIYKYTTDSTFWGDVEFSGESAFAPSLRVGYAVSEWFGLEGWSGVSFSKYTSSIVNRYQRRNEIGAAAIPDPALGEFDAEERSLITMQLGVNAVVYPLSISRETSRRWHPYLTGGVGNMWYDMNSNFTLGAASALDMNFGGGIRVLADRNISVRFEAIMHRNELEWTPADYFLQLNEGTTTIPLDEFPVLSNGALDQKPVTKFESNTVSLIQWSIGVQGSF